MFASFVISSARLPKEEVSLQLLAVSFALDSHCHDSSHHCAGYRLPGSSDTAAPPPSSGLPSRGGNHGCGKAVTVMASVWAAKKVTSSPAQCLVHATIPCLTTHACSVLLQAISWLGTDVHSGQEECRASMCPG